VSPAKGFKGFKGFKGIPVVPFNQKVSGNADRRQGGLGF